MGDVSIEVSKEVVNGIIEKKIEAAVVEAFTDKDEMVRNMVNLALTRKVSSDGTPSRSSYDNKFTLIDVLFSKALKEAAEEAIKKNIEANQDKLEAALMKELKRQNSKIARMMVANMQGSLGKYNFQLNIREEQD